MHVVYEEPIYKLFDKSYLRKPIPMGDDSKKRNQRWKYAYHDEKRHRIDNSNALKSFLDQLVQNRHLEEYVIVKRQRQRKPI